MKMLLLLFLIPVAIYSQIFEIFDIDKTNFPTMSAKITSSYQNGTRILNQETSEFKLTENGVNRTVTNLDYSNGIGKKASSVIIIDMNILEIKYRDLIKSVAKYWVESMSEGSECSIISINDTNHLVQNFTEDKSILINAIEGKNRTNQTTKIENAFIKPPNSGFQQIQKAKNDRKNIIVFSNSYDSYNSVNTNVYFISVIDRYGDRIDSVCSGTNGQFFYGLDNEAKIIKELNIIRSKLEQSNALIEWDSEYNCTDNIEISIYNSQNQMTTESNYTKTDEMMAKLLITPGFINFGEVQIGSHKDTTINVYASNKDLIIEDFQVKYGSSNYTVTDDLPIELMKGESKELHLRYSPTDSTKSYSQYNIVTNYCSNPLYFLGGYKYQDTVIKATTILSPAKNQYYLYKDEIVINWTKVPNFDRYILQFSANNGGNWSTITDSAIGTSYTWKAPHLNSDKCLIRIETYFEPEKKFFEHEWDKSFGISKNDDSNKLIQTSDGGYLTVGTTRGKDSSTTKKLYNDILVCKLDKDGKQLWTKTYGGKEGEDAINSVIEADDKSLMLIGKTNSIDFEENLKGDYDLLLMKIDKLGNLIWKKNYGGSKYDIGIDIEKDKEGNFYLGGYTGSVDGDIVSTHGWSDYWVLKVNKDGEIIWTNTYGRSKDELLTDMQLSMDGGLILYGSSNSVDTIPVPSKGGGFDNKNHAWVVKIDKDGKQLWDYQYVHETENPFNLIENSKGEIIISGYSVIYNLGNPLTYGWFCKLDVQGKLIWNNRNLQSNIQAPFELELDKDDNFYIVSNCYQSWENYYKLMTKYSTEGKELWYKKVWDEGRQKGFTKTYDNGLSFITLNPNKDLEEKELLLVKLSNEQLYELGYSDLFEIASSKPYFTIDEIVFDTTYRGEVRDTIIDNILCNEGVVPIDITNTKFIVDYTEFRIDSIYTDGTLEQGECLGMGFSFSTQLTNRRQSYFYAAFPFGKLDKRVNFKSFIVDKKLENKSDWFRFGEVKIGQKTEKKFINLRNYSQFPIKINLKHNYSSPNEIVLNNGVNEFYMDGESYYKVPIEYIAIVEKKDTMTLKIYYDDSVAINPVYILAESINDPNTSVNDYVERSSSISINPNPASEQLNIDITTGVQGTMKLELVATDGRVIYSGEWTQSTKSKQMQINTINIPSGLYQVRLITPYDAITKSVIVVE